MNYKTKKTIKWIIIGGVLTVLTLITAFAFFVIMFLTGGAPSTSDRVEDYQDIFELHLSSGSGLIVFPEKLPENMKDITFSYYHQDTFNMPTVCIFFQGTYTPEKYAEEVSRLKNTRKVYGGTERMLLRDEEGRYSYPAFIAVENHSHAYEYALLTGENQITYIFTAFFDREDVEFDSKYLPSDYMTEEGREFGSGYNIYVKRQDSGMIDYDTTRDEYVDVSFCHTEMFNDSFFMVRVKLDEQNREIIEQCEYYHYASAAAYATEESEDTFWTDLQGYEFVDLEIDRTNETALVTYLDGGEEKKWSVKL